MEYKKIFVIKNGFVEISFQGNLKLKINNRKKL